MWGMRAGPIAFLSLSISSCQRRLKAVKLLVRKRLPPVEFKFVRVPVRIKLIECFCKGFAELLHRTEMSKYQFTFGQFTFAGRILINLKQNAFALASQKTKIKLLRITVPRQYIFGTSRALFAQLCEYL